MKTQINTLVKGNHQIGICGTKKEIRNKVAKQVIAENPNSMKIAIRGIDIELHANWSVSGKSVTYFGEISTSLYHDFFGNFGIPKKDAKAFCQINADMSVCFTTNSKKSFYQIVKEAEVTIF